MSMYLGRSSRESTGLPNRFRPTQGLVTALYTEAVQLCTLGGLKLEGAAFSQPRPLLLLAYLAVEGPQERRHLAELFWPESDHALKNLRTVITRLESAASDLVERNEVRIWTSVACDASALLTTLEESESRDGIDRYAGPFLDGLAPKGLSGELEEWVLTTREFLAARVRDALLDVAEIEASQGRIKEAAGGAERAFALAGAPALEPRDLARLHTLMIAGGNLRAEEVRKEALEFDVTLVASQAEARERLRSLHQDDVHHFSNLPNRNTSFVGRQRELFEVTNLLVQSECRLLSLVGIGGVGKTRLALGVAREQIEKGRFSDGVVFVALEAVSDPASLPPVVAVALGLDLSGQQDAKSVVVRFLAGKQLLLVLDNFEQVLGGMSFLRELIDGCPRLKLLVTSRERLNVEAEWVFEIEGLAYPKETEAPERAAHFDAVQLFLQRAKRAQQRFSLTPETLPPVLRICQLVEGMPLALELAASWLRALPVGGVARELEVSAEVLESPAQDVPERFRNPHRVFDPSWALLSEREQELLRGLSVFRGGFRREAAGAVAGATLPLLAGLVDKSLLRMGPDGRYDRHPLLLQYTREKLAERPEQRARVEERHGRYYLEFVRELEPDLWTGKARRTFRVFMEDLANIRVAWDWASLNLQLGEIEETTPAMFDFFWFRLLEGLEHFGTTSEFFGQIVESLDETDPHHAGALGTVLIHQVLLPRQMHRNPDFHWARAQARRGIKLLRSVGEHRGLSRGFHVVGASSRHLREDVEVRKALAQALDEARKHGSSSDTFYALRAMSLYVWSMQSLAQRRRFAQESLEELRALNNQLGVAYFLHETGACLVAERRFDEGEAMLVEAKQLAEELGHLEFLLFAVLDLSDVSFELGEFDRAAAYAREAYRRAEEVGHRLLLPLTLGRMGRTEAARGDFEEAWRLLRRAIEEAWARRHRQQVEDALVFVAELLIAEERSGEAAALLPLVGGPLGPKSRILTEFESSLPPEEVARARSRGRTLEEVVRELTQPLREGGVSGAKRDPRAGPRSGR